MKQFKITARRRVYFSNLVFLILLMCMFYFYLIGTEGAGETLLLSFLFFLLLNASLYLHIVTIEKNCLTYKNYFYKKKILLRDIKRYEFKIGVFKYSDRFKPTVRMEVYSKISNKSICIPVKLFRNEDVEKLKYLLDLAGKTDNP